MITPELKEAIQKFIPEYFSWDQEQQEKYRTNIPEETKFKINQFLLKKLFQQTVSNEEEFEDAWRELTDAQTTKFNSIILPIQGIGEDLLFFNENFAASSEILQFKTLYEYDLADFALQETLREEEDKSYIKQPYNGYLAWVWGRLFIDKKFYYATLSMLSFHLYAELEEYGESYLKKLIPYDFYPGENHLKETDDGCYIHDMKLNANGLESQLRQLQDRVRESLEKLHQTFIEEQNSKPDQYVYILDQTESDDPHKYILFSNPEVLKKIHLKTFMRDCRKFEQKDHSTINNRLDEEKAKIKTFINNQYQKIIPNP